MLILGTGELAKKLAAEIISRPDVGFKIVGFVSEDASLVGKSLVNPTVLGHVSELNTIVEKEKVREVVVAMSESRGSVPNRRHQPRRSSAGRSELRRPR